MEGGKEGGRRREGGREKEGGREREREKAREGGRQKERGKERNVDMCLFARACVYVYERTHTNIHMFTATHIHLFNTSLRVCVCVRVCLLNACTRIYTPVQWDRRDSVEATAP